MKNFTARIACSFVFVALIFSGSAQADTELKFEKAVYYGSSGNQAGHVVDFGQGQLFLAGIDHASDKKSLVTSFAMPPADVPLASLSWNDQITGATSVATTFTDVAVTDEGLYFSGFSLAQMSGKKKTTQLSGILAKFSPTEFKNGTPLWVAHPSFFTETNGTVLRAVLAVQEQSSTVVYVAGHASNQTDNDTAVFAKYDANGNLLWSKILGETGTLQKSAGTSLAVLDGYIYVAGYISSNEKKVKYDNLPLHPTLWKYDSSGNQVWMKTLSSTELLTYDDSDNVMQGIKVGLAVSDGYFYLTSGKKSTSASKGDILLVKYDQNGELVWETGWEAESSPGEAAKNGWALGIAAGKDRLYVSGFIKNKANKGFERGEDAFILEIDKVYGSILAVHTHGESDRSENAFAVMTNGTDLYVTGVRKVMEDQGKKKPVETTDLALLRYSVLPVTEVSIEIEPSASGVVVLKDDEKAEADTDKKKKKKDEPEVKKVSVAILSTEKFKAATDVKLDSLTFGRTGNEASWTGCSTDDVNGDGSADLLCYFEVSWTPWESLRFILKEGDTQGILKGMTRAGERFMGKDAVKVGESNAPAPEPEPPAPTPTPEPEPAPPLTSGPPAPDPAPTPEPASPAPVPPAPSVSEPETPTLPTTDSSDSTSQEPDPIIIEEPTPTNPSTLPSSQEPLPAGTNQEEKSLPPVQHATIIQPPTTQTTTTAALKPVFIPQFEGTNQPTATSTAPVALMPSTSKMSTAPNIATTSSTSLPAVYGSRSGEVQHVGGMFSSGSEETEIFKSEAPAETRSLRSEGDASRPGSGLGRAYGDLGKKAFREGKISEAVTHYSEALKLDPQSPELHTDFGLVLFQEGRLDEAKTHFEEALKLNPDDSVARENLNLILAKLNKPPVEITPAAPVSGQAPAPKA